MRSLQTLGARFRRSAALLLLTATVGAGGLGVFEPPQPAVAAATVPASERATLERVGAPGGVAGITAAPTAALWGGTNLKISSGSIPFGWALDLTWDGGTLQTSYVLLRYNTATATASLTNLPGTATSYQDATVVTEVMYCYVVAAVGTSEVKLSDLLCGLTYTGDDFKLGLNQTNQASMTWSAPPGGVDAYLMVNVPLDGSPATFQSLPAATTAAVRTVVAAGTCYQLIAYQGPAIGQSDIFCGVPNVATVFGATPSNWSALAAARPAIDSMIAGRQVVPWNALGNFSAGGND